MQEFDQELPPEKRRIPYRSVSTKGLVVTGVVLAIIIATRDPVNGGPRVILLFLATLFFMLASIMALLLQFIWLLNNKADYSGVRLLYSSMTLSFGVVFLLGLQTLGQLRVVDIVLVGLLEVVLLFYIIRRF